MKRRDRQRDKRGRRKESMATLVQQPHQTASERSASRNDGNRERSRNGSNRQDLQGPGLVQHRPWRSGTGGFLDKMPMGSVMNRSITIRTGHTHVAESGGNSPASFRCSGV